MVTTFHIHVGPSISGGDLVTSTEMEAVTEITLDVTLTNTDRLESIIILVSCNKV